MAKNNRNKAKKMATAGKSAAQIKAKTGVRIQAARSYVEKLRPTPAPASRSSQTPTTNDQGPPRNTASPTNPGISTSPSRSNSSSSTPEIKGINQGIRIAGENGISKRDFRTIAETTGKDPEKIIAKLDKINTRLDKKGKAGIDLKSGTGNMLVRKAQKMSDKYRGYRTPDFGEGAIGSVLQSMLSTPGNAGTWIKGKLTGVREGDPGFNPGGSPNKNRLIGGTVIRPDGKIANKEVGEQYELPKRFRDEEDPKDPKDPITKVIKEPDKPPGKTEDDIITTTTTDDGLTETTEEGPVEETDLSASSGAGGLNLASWATGFRKARSARQKSGRPAQGIASQKKNPFKSWA
jgi:hypothetical protein